MNYHSGLRWQGGSGIGSLFSGIFRGLMLVARSAVKTIERVARSAPIRSAGKALKKEATKVAVETALDALEGQLVSRKAKQRLKYATRGILLNAARQADTNNEYQAHNSSRKRKAPSIAQSRKKRRRITKEPVLKINDNKRGFLKEYAKPGSPIAFASPALIYYYYGKKIPLTTIEEWLKGTDSYTLHKQPKFPRPRDPTFAYQKRYQFQIDLIDLGNLIKENDSNRYLLTAIDIFTRFAFLEPLKIKQQKLLWKGLNLL